MQLPWYLHQGMKDGDAFLSRNTVLEQRLTPPPLPSYNQLHSSLPGAISSAVGQMHFYLLVSYCSKSPSMSWQHPHVSKFPVIDVVCRALNARLASLSPALAHSPSLLSGYSHVCSFSSSVPLQVHFHMFLLDGKNPFYSLNYSYFLNLNSIISSYYSFLTFLGCQKHSFNARDSGASINIC